MPKRPAPKFHSVRSPFKQLSKARRVGNQMSLAPVAAAAASAIGQAVANAAVAAATGQNEVEMESDGIAGSNAYHGYAGSSSLGNRIQKPRSRPPAGIYAKYGSFGEDEVYGKMSKADMVGLGFCSVKTFGMAESQSVDAGSVAGTLSYHVAAALLRYILKREFNYSVERHEQYVCPYRLDTVHTADDHANADPCPQILFYWKKQVQPSIVAQYNQAPQIGLGYRLVLSTKITTSRGSQLKTFTELAREIQKYVITHGDYGAVADQSNLYNSLYAYQVVMPDAAAAATGTPYVNAAYRPLVLLEDCYIKAYSVGELTLQNVTVSDNTAGAAETTQYLANRIDSNPVQGRILKFVTPFPVVKIPTHVVWSNNTLQTATGGFGSDPLATAEPDSGATQNAWELCFDRDGNGIVTPKGTLLHSWKQLPRAHQFRYCSGEGNFIMRPGEIRNIRLRYSFDGKINNFINSQQLNFGTTQSHLGVNNTRGCGTSVLLMMEKVMSTGTSSDVTINFQQCYYAGAVVTGCKRVIMQPYQYDHKSVYGNLSSNPNGDDQVEIPAPA